MTAFERQMQAVLLTAADQFGLYADYHLAKNPPDVEKAKTNTEFAEMCLRATLSPEQE